MKATTAACSCRRAKQRRAPRCGKSCAGQEHGAASLHRGGPTSSHPPRPPSCHPAAGRQRSGCGCSRAPGLREASGRSQQPVLDSPTVTWPGFKRRESRCEVAAAKELWWPGARHRQLRAAGTRTKAHGQPSAPGRADLGHTDARRIPRVPVRHGTAVVRSRPSTLPW